MAAIVKLYFSSRATCLITDRMTLDASGIIAPIPWTLLLQNLPAVYSGGQRTRALGTFFIPRDRLRELRGVAEQTLRATG
jgi:hypothetical protein